jgi:hypothetical protein
MVGLPGTRKKLALRHVQSVHLMSTGRIINPGLSRNNEQAAMRRENAAMLTAFADGACSIASAGEANGLIPILHD